MTVAGALTVADAGVLFTANLPHSDHNKRRGEAKKTTVPDKIFGTLITDNFAKKVAEVSAKYHLHSKTTYFLRYNTPSYTKSLQQLNSGSWPGGAPRRRGRG